MNVRIERWTDTAEIPQITALLNSAYAQLAAIGFRYVATYQDDSITRERLERGESFLAREDGSDGRIVGTINLCRPGLAGDTTPWYSRPDVALFGQFGVLPECQGRGIGSQLLGKVEERAMNSVLGSWRAIPLKGRRSSSRCTGGAVTG